MAATEDSKTGGSETGTKTKGDSFLEILDIVCENVASDWKLLADQLHLSRKDIQTIEEGQNQKTPEDCCWRVLCKWRAAAPSVLQSRELTEALFRCRHGRMADIVSRLVNSSDSIEEVLMMHTDREYKVQEAMYMITDSSSRHWRLLSQRLGLTREDIAVIENSLPAGRTREKCMQALYRWRSLVPLKEYKVASLILVLRECQLHDVAVDVTEMAASPYKLCIRRKKKGEVLIHVDIDHIDIEIPRQHQTSKGSRRPRYLMPQEALRHYTLNRIFIRFMDDLDQQDRTGVHPLVSLFYELNGSSVSEVCRRGQYLAVSCPSKAQQAEIWRLAENGTLSFQLTQLLVSEEMTEQLGMKNIKLTCTVHETELCTPRTGVSQATTRSDKS